MTGKRYSFVGLVISGILLMATVGGARPFAQTQAQQLGAYSPALDVLASNDPAVRGFLSPGISTARVKRAAVPPAQKACQQNDSGERIKCKTQNLVAQMDYTVEQLSAADVFTPEQTELFTKESKRAKDKVGRTDASGFRELTKKRKPECHVVEYVTDDPDDPFYGDGDDDGLCITKGPDKEMCLEDNTDGIGDDNSLCEKLHEKGGKPIQEPCAEVCELDAIEADDGNFDPVAAQETEGSLDDIGAVFAEINPKIATRMQMLETVEALVTGQDSPAASECADLLAGTRQRLFSFEELEGIQAGGWAAKLGADACRDACTQTSFGWNCRAVCVALGSAENVLGAIAAGFELQDDTVTAERIDASLQCLEVLGQEITAIKDGVDEANQKLDEVIRLLNLAPGKRPDFPGCDNDGKCDPNEDVENCPGDCGS